MTAPNLDENVEGQTVDVVDVAQPKEAGEEAAGQHPHRQVEADGQALADDAAAATHALPDDASAADVQRLLDFT